VLCTVTGYSLLVTVRSTVTSPFYLLRAGTSAQPTRLGWVQPTVYGPGQAQPRMVGPDPAQFFYFIIFFVKRKFQKYLFVILQVSSVFFMSFWLISSNTFFMLLKIQNPILKYLVFVKTSKIKKKLCFEKMFLCIRSSVSKLKKSYCIFHTKKKTMF
jgi:hypothetical protein